ncbi:hypothetical protein KGQ20_19795 [Catenulispora sp. NF23]|uniref:Lipoprotein n=1 Tax=Catenulispora pinistramenti TaxID=2705254 RepID=A0ABS5KZZ1_9ACTN|nr:hypothetical protein [Catenulispora pinistramenti]MBS2535016.1 hypothetical protein [Catenulispora pinistramenti]MBS2551626.1 hypothetical protein [Catenulispora pinistramenti]
MRGNRYAAMAAVVAVTVAVSVAGAGCSSSGSIGPDGADGQAASPSAALIEEMKQFHDTGAARAYVDFGQTAQLTALWKGTSSPPADSEQYLFPSLQARGLDAYNAAVLSSLTPLVGFDPSQAAQAIDVGDPQHAVGVLEGHFDPAAIGAKLAAAGLTQKDLGGGQTEWDVPVDSAAHYALQKAGVDDSLDVLRVTTTKIIYGRDNADLDAALDPTSPALSADKLDSALAGCLGDPTAAVLENAVMIGSPGYSGLAAGDRVTSATDATDVLCVAAPDDTTAQKYATTMTSTIQTGTQPKTGLPWSRFLTAPSATVVGGPEHLVRLTAKPDPAHTDALFQAVDDRTVGALMGLPIPGANLGD